MVAVVYHALFWWWISCVSASCLNGADSNPENSRARCFVRLRGLAFCCAVAPLQLIVLCLWMTEYEHAKLGPLILCGTAIDARGLVCHKGTIYAFRLRKPDSSNALAAPSAPITLAPPASTAASGGKTSGGKSSGSGGGGSGMDMSTDYIVPTPTSKPLKLEQKAAATVAAGGAGPPAGPLSVVFAVATAGMVQAMTAIQPPVAPAQVGASSAATAAASVLAKSQYLLASATDRVFLYRFDTDSTAAAADGGGLIALARLSMRYVVVSLDCIRGDDTVAVTTQYDSTALFRVSPDRKSFLPIAVDPTARQARQSLLLTTPISNSNSPSVGSGLADAFSLGEPNPSAALSAPAKKSAQSDVKGKSPALAAASSPAVGATAAASPLLLSLSTPALAPTGPIASAPYRVFGIDKSGAAYVLRDNPIVTPDTSSSLSSALWTECESLRLLSTAPTRMRRGSIAYAYGAAGGSGGSTESSSLGGISPVLVSTVSGGLCAFVPITKREANRLSPPAANAASSGFNPSSPLAMVDSTALTDPSTTGLVQTLCSRAL